MPFDPYFTSKVKAEEKRPTSWRGYFQNVINLRGERTRILSEQEGKRLARIGKHGKAKK